MATECPKPGIYPDVSFDEYLSWPAISNSSLNSALRSMAHYKNRSDAEETPAMRLGTLCHSGKFEPLTIHQKYTVVPESEIIAKVRTKDGAVPKNPKMTDEYKRAVEEYVLTAQAQGKLCVSDSQMQTMLGTVKALSQHERASQYLAVGFGDSVETAIVWIDNDTGLLCKGRVDSLNKKARIAGDLKTTADASDFGKTIFNRRYHRQGAFYLDGLYSLTADKYQFCIVAVETLAPYCVVAAPLNEEAIDVGRAEYTRLLRKIAESREKNTWPGYESPDVWELPAWAAKDNEEVELIIGNRKVRL